MGGTADIGIERPHAADEHGHFRHGEGEHVGAVHQHFRRGQAIVLAEIIAETIGRGFQLGKGRRVRLGLRGIHAAGLERHGHRGAGLAGGALDGGTAGEHDEIGERDLLAAAGLAVEVLLDGLQRGQHLGQFGGAVGLPVAHRCEADAGAIGPAAHVRAAEAGSGRPGSADQLGIAEAGGEDAGLELGDILGADQRMIDSGNRILPRQGFLGYFGTDVAGAGAHVAVGELEPGLGEGQLELGRVLEEALRDLAVARIELQREIGGEHDRLVRFGRIMGIRHGAGTAIVLGHPLHGTGRALGLHPIKGEQVLEILHRERHRAGGPSAFEAAGDGVCAAAGAALVFPAEALLFHACCGWLLADAIFRALGAVRLAEGVATGDQRHGLFVIHRHAAEGFANVPGGEQRVRLAVGAFRIDVDQAHLDGGEGVLELAVPAVALIGEELGFRAPIDEIGFPIIGAAAAIAEGLEAHVLQADVAGEDHEIGPGDLAAILLLHRPEQAAGLVQVDVVRPAVEWLEALLATAGAAAAIGNAIGAGAVPGHADEERAIVAIIRRPPRLGGGEHRLDILLHGGEIERLELGGVIEIVTKRVGLGGVLAQRLEIELLGPPELVGDGLFLRHLLGRGRAGGEGRRKGDCECRKQKQGLFGHFDYSPVAMILLGT